MRYQRDTAPRSSVVRARARCSAADTTHVQTRAGRVGFEPTGPVKVHRFSRPEHSTALPPAPTSCATTLMIARTLSKSHLAPHRATDSDVSANDACGIGIY